MKTNENTLDIAQPQKSNTPASLKSPDKKRIEWVDITKGIAIIMVITSHTIGYDIFNLPDFFMFMMPLFFVMSGYTFKVRSVKDTLKLSAKNLLVPYVILFLVWQGVTFLQEPNAFTSEVIGRYLLMFLFASGAPSESLGVASVGITWFLVCLFASRILLSILLNAFKRYSLKLIWQALCFIILGALGVLLGGKLKIFLPLDFDLALVMAGFMWLGFIARRYNLVEKSAKRWYVVIATLLIFAICATFSSLSVSERLYGVVGLSIIGAISGSLLACWISMAIERRGHILKTFLLFMGRNSLLVYCFHSIDWLIPWASLAALQGIPGQRFITAIIRVAHAALLTWLARKV